MSIFDKYNANPYVSTYAGAPVAEYQQVSGALQQRMDQNLAKSDQLEIAMKNLEVSDVDEDYKAQKIKEYQTQLEEIAQAPEHSTQKVRALSKQLATDEGLKEAQANKQRIAAIQKEIAEGDYSDFQIRKFNEELANYKEKDENGLSGIAAGRRFGAVNFYEERDLNTETLDQVKGILGEKFGAYERDSAGVLATTQGATISEDRVRGVAQGVLSNSKVMRQVADEYKLAKGLPSNENLSTEKHSEGLQEFFNSRYVDPAIAKFVKTDERTTAKTGKTTAYGSYKVDGSSLRNAVAAPRQSQLMKSKFTDDIELTEAYATLKELERNLSNNTYNNINEMVEVENTITELKGTLRRVLTNEDIITDAETREILAGIEDDDELWKLVNPAGDMDHLEQVLSQINLDEDMPFAMGARELAQQGFDFAEMQKIQTELTEKHGPQVATAYVNAVKPNNLQNAAKDRLRYQKNAQGVNYGTRIPKDLLQQTMKEIKRERLEDLRSNYNTITEGETGIALKNIEQILIQNGMDEGIARDRAVKLKARLDDSMFKTTYSNALEDGMLDVGVKRQNVNANSILNDSQIEVISGQIASLFNTDDGDLSFLEAFEVLDSKSGEAQALENPDKFVKEYQVENLVLDGIDATNGMGFVELLIPARKDGEPPKRIAIDLDDDVMNNARFNIANSAGAKASAYELMETTSPEQEALRLAEIQSARAVQFNFESGEILNEISRTSVLNASAGSSDRQAIKSNLIVATLGNIYAMKNADEQLYFEDEDGRNIFADEIKFDNVQQGWGALMKKAKTKFNSASEALNS